MRKKKLRTQLAHVTQSRDDYWIRYGKLRTILVDQYGQRSFAGYGPVLHQGELAEDHRWPDWRKMYEDEHRKIEALNATVTAAQVERDEALRKLDKIGRMTLPADTVVVQRA